MSGNAQISSNRDLILRFAAHLAHLLNATDVKPFALYRGLLQLLCEQRYGRGLVGRHLQDARTSPEEAAMGFFRQVLERPMLLARDGHTHKAHELFLALCQRAQAAGWSEAVLMRIRDITTTSITRPPDGFQQVAERLRKLPVTYSPGNPAKQTRIAAGPLYLKVGAVQEVVDELSVWAAICCAPTKLDSLAQGPEFNAFCSIVIKVLETANAHYGTLISLGLSPLDWRELPVNTAKKLSAFIMEVRGQTTEEQQIAVWRQVWVNRQVPGFDNADALWTSPLGSALRIRAPLLAADVEIDDIDIGGSDLETEILENASFKPMLIHCRDAGVILQVEVDFLLSLHEGAAIEDIAALPAMRSGLGNKLSKTNCESYLADLQERLRTFARSMIMMMEE